MDYIAKLHTRKNQKGSQQRGPEMLLEASFGLEVLSVKAQVFMRYCPFLQPDFVPLTLAMSLAGECDSQLPGGVVKELQALSLVKVVRRDGHVVGLQVHRQVQAFCTLYQNWDQLAAIGG